MDNEKRKLAIQALTKEIQKHTERLYLLLLMESDATMGNGNYFPKASCQYVNLNMIREDKQSVLITISDLEQIKHSLERKKTHLTIMGFNCNGVMAKEIRLSLSLCHLTISNEDPYTGEIWLS